MSFRVVIPARMGSERLPGKPLADIHGRPMVVCVAEAASRSGATEVLVATDDERVVRAVTDAGFQARMTGADHPSGSDRIMEVVAAEGWPDDEVVLNVQGDEPLIPPEVLDQLGAVMQADPDLASATLCEPITRVEDLTDPNVVKVVRAADQNALYFSRGAIPFRRGAAVEEWLTGGEGPEANWWRHIGVYAYRAKTLRRFVALPAGRLEAIERLEQLRLLENGMGMRVVEACREVPGGIDTVQDLERVRRLLKPLG